MLNFSVDTQKCVSCGICVKDCPRHALQMEGYPTMRDERACLRCLHCVAVCPSGAVSILGCSAKACTPLKGGIPTPQQMETLIKGRRSVRQYMQKDIDPDLLRSLLHVASHAPTGSNCEQLVVSVLHTRKAMDAFRSEVYQRLNDLADSDHMPDVPRREFFLQAGRMWKEGEDPIFRGAPHACIVSNAKTASCVLQDPVIYLSYFELLAQSHGVGTVWCGLLNWCLRFVMPEMLPRLGIPQTHELGYIVLFGYPKVTYWRTVEKHLDDSCVLVDWK